MAISPELKKQLLQVARDAAGQAYCPISQFHVGAALLANGQIIEGCNVENASFGLTICAERVAIFNAISKGHNRIEALAIACPDAMEESPNSKMPCGACRQVMAEFSDPELLVLIDGVGEFLLRQLLPT